MNTSSLTASLEHIPLEGFHKLYTSQDLFELSKVAANDLFAIELAVGLDAECMAIFDMRHVPDDVREAFQMSFGRIADHQSLYEHYLNVLDRGPRSVVGFISNMKGKLAEIRMPELLHHEFPNVTWTMPDSPIQPIYDLVGHTSNGTEILLQSKIGGQSYVHDILQRMHEHPNVLFALSKEIHDAVMTQAPELTHQLVDVGISNFQFTQEVAHDLALIAANHGIDVPDSVGDILPYAKDVVLGIRLLMDICNVERDFRHVQLDQRGRIHALKALMLFSRFGVTIVCTKCFGAVGAKIDILLVGHGFGLPTLAGAAAGAIFGARLNKMIKPHVLEIGMKLFDMSEDDMFYLRNKLAIDRSAESFAANASKLAQQLAAA